MSTLKALDVDVRDKLHQFLHLLSLVNENEPEDLAEETGYFQAPVVLFLGVPLRRHSGADWVHPGEGLGVLPENS